MVRKDKQAGKNMLNVSQNLKRARFSRANLAIVALIVAGIGGYMLLTGSAATLTKVWGTDTELNSGTLTSTTVSGTGSSAKLQLSQAGGSTGTPSLYVSTTGSDSNNCTQASPCLTFSRAYLLATAGTLVGVLPGSYGSQTIPWDTSKNTAGAAQVVFKPTSTTPCTGLHHGSFSNSFAFTPCVTNLASLSVRGWHVTIQDMSVTDGIDAAPPDSNRAQHPAYIQLLNLHSTGGALKADHSAMIGGEIGGRDVCNSSGPDDGLDLYWYTSPANQAPIDETISGVMIHDIYDSDNNGGGGNGCNRGAHIDCVQMSDVSQFTFTKNREWNCATSGLITSCTNLCGSISGQYVADNMVGKIYAAGSSLNVGRQTDNIGGCVVENNSVDNTASNTFGCSGTPAMIIRGNVFARQSACLNQANNADYNVFYGSGGTVCGAHAKSCTPAWANSGSLDLGDLSVLSTDTCIVGAGSPNGQPTDDYYGVLRPSPVGSVADAGAQELGGTTPTGSGTYSTSGTAVYSFDAGQSVSWTSLTDSQSTPTGTTATLEARSSSDNSTWSGWVSAASVSSLAANRYIQVRANLNTTDTSQTPTIDSISLGYATSTTSTIGDVNLDGHVDITDLSILLTNYGTTTASCDFNTDGAVNIVDLSILLSHYGS